MKTAVVVAMFVIFGGVVHGYGKGPEYIDMAALAKDAEALQAIMYCFNDLGPCGHVTQNLKAQLPEIMQEACAKCSPPQKLKMKQFLDGSRDLIPEDYAFFQRKYDPTGTLFPAFLASLE